MFKNVSTILIWSENYRALADWYQEKLELEILEEIHHPDDTGVRFRVGDGATLWIGQHSQVHGKNKDMHRHMFNIVVDSVSETYAYLKDKGVIFIAEPFKAPTFDKYFATFCDFDGNIIQIIGNK